MFETSQWFTIDILESQKDVSRKPHTFDLGKKIMYGLIMLLYEILFK